MKKYSENDVTESCGNIFADLELENAEELHAKGLLAISILKIINERKLTQTETAELLGTDQSQVSRLKHGQIEGFTFDRLLNWLTKFDRNIVLTIKPKTKNQNSGTIRVAM